MRNLSLRGTFWSSLPVILEELRKSIVEPATNLAFYESLFEDLL